ncbi:MAG: Maf family protein [Phycisphaerae bacterium]|nr:Maf family protein [Phycisphaerae bacterium]
MPTPAQPRPLILASASPRRAELLREAGYEFRVVTPPLHEPDPAHPHVDPLLHAEALAYFKARAVATDHPGAVVLGADTIVVVEHDVIGKPEDRADAGRILRRLAGTTHRVITGVALVHLAESRRVLRHDATSVVMRPLTDADIETYLDSGEWQGKAGAYGIQDHGDAFVERIEGSYTNVVGLPVDIVGLLLERWSRTPQPAP